MQFNNELLCIPAARGGAGAGHCSDCISHSHCRHQQNLDTVTPRPSVNVTCDFELQPVAAVVCLPSHLHLCLSVSIVGTHIAGSLNLRDQHRSSGWRLETGSQCLGDTTAPPCRAPPPVNRCWQGDSKVLPRPATRMTALPSIQCSHHPLLRTTDIINPN